MSFMKENNKKQQKNIVIYTSSRGVDLRVQMENESLWLTQKQISELYGKKPHCSHEACA